MPSTDTLIWTLKLAGIIVPALGLALLIVGLRGRRIGDAPHCRQCKYNLTGVPSTRCPECGHDLTTLRYRRRIYISSFWFFSLEDACSGARLIFARKYHIPEAR